MTLQATVLIPTHDHGETLRYAVKSALGQTVQDLEVFIIGDGVPDTAKRVIAELVEQDSRIRFFDHPKHERRGEPYRHAALREACGRIVCYLGDRDIWLPDHVEFMLTLLQDADFANTLPLHVLPGDVLRPFPVDLSSPFYRKMHLFGQNRIPFSCATHTLAMYRRLPHGWRTTPKGLATDLYMFQQFLSQPECRATSGVHPTAITFPSSRRRETWSTAQRLQELERWAQKIADEHSRRLFQVEVLETALRAYNEEANGILHSRTWRFLYFFQASVWRFLQRVENTLKPQKPTA